MTLTSFSLAFAVIAGGILAVVGIVGTALSFGKFVTWIMGG